MDFYAISALINAVTSLTLGCFVFFKNKRNLTNNTFILLSFSVFFWSVFYFLWQISNTYYEALNYTRLLSIGSTLIPIFYLHWVLSFLEAEDKFSNFVLLFGYTITTVFLIFSFSPYFVRDVEPMIFFQYWPKAGFLYTTYLITSYIGLFGYGAIQLLREYYKTKGLKHYQIKYILIGTVFGFLGGITNFFLWYDILIPPVGNVVISLYVFILFYAMIKFRLMDVRIVARKVFIYIVISAFAYSFFYLLILFYNTFFGGVFNIGSYAFGLIVAPFFVLAFYNANKITRGFANKYIFSSLYNYQETISKLTEELTNHIDLNIITKLIVTTIKDTIEIEEANIYLVNNKTLPLSYKIASTSESGKNKDKIKTIKNNYLIDTLSKNQKILVGEELDLAVKENGNNETKQKYENIIEYMKELKASVILPLVANKKLIGIITLDSKKSKDPYTKEDLELLTVLSNQAGIAIENARQYKQIKEFGKTLEEKVYEQTKDIKQNNQYLQELLTMKSDFLRVVSHQLNTPLSIIRGYFSMMKEGDYESKKALPVIEAGLYRIINTVADFCDAYKMEGEKMKTEPIKMDIDLAVKAVVKEKLGYAKEKGLKLTILPPKAKLPDVWCDQEKISRAIANIIENAISYTKKGAIEISYKTIKDMLEVSIRDEGSGITKEDRDKIFQKFSRGEKAPSIHPDGSGLGLYIAKKIAEGNGGDITYESKGENKGTIFRITIPIYKKQDKKIKRK
ncbi:ATP-binding protein [bacterium]|nr:ATP-binding protein [bacterium]